MKYQTEERKSVPVELKRWRIEGESINKTIEGIFVILAFGVRWMDHKGL